MFIFIINIKNIFRIYWSYWQTSIIVHSYVDVVLTGLYGHHDDDDGHSVPLY